MATNNLLTPSVIAKEALMHLENNIVLGGLVHRDYKNEFVKVGSTVTIRRPVKFLAQSGPTFVRQDVTEGSTSITIDQEFHVGWGFSTLDLSLSVEQYSERYIKPAAIALANKVDERVALLYRDCWNLVGTAGQTINSYADFSKIPERLDEGAVPNDMRNAVLSPADHWGLAGSQTGLFIEQVAQPAYRKGTIGRIANIDTYQDQNIQTHTVGVATGTPLINGATQGVTYASVRTTYEQSLITDGWTASQTGILKRGDVFTIANVFAVNPVSKATLPYLQPFVVKADANSDGSGNATFTVSPPIITSGPYQTVNADVADNAAITVISGTGGTGYRQNLGFHKNALALVMVPKEMPDGASFKARETHNDLSIRVIKWYDGTNDEDLIRLDIMFGTKAIYPDLLTRAYGTA